MSAFGIYRGRSENRAHDDRPSFLLKKRLFGIVALIIIAAGGAFWWINSANPETPAGYVGYVTQHPIFGEVKFLGMQTGPKSPGRTWRARVVNVPITPSRFTEEFAEDSAVLASDNLKLTFRVHAVLRVKEDHVQEFVEKYGANVADTYKRFVQEDFREFTRHEVTKYKGLEAHTKSSEAGEAIYQRMVEIASSTPFEVVSVAMGNIQYPSKISDAVADKIEANEIAEKKQNELAQSQADAAKKIVDAQGTASSTIIAAEAEAEAIRIKTGELTPIFVRYYGYNQWNGELSDVQVNGGNSPDFMFDVSNLGKLTQ
jgi:regulator of protease activity HflC (stomatin/prohibitin superfamily)